MAPRGRTPFDPSKPVYARRKFVAAGRRFLPNNEFDWKRLSVAQRKVRLMFNSGHLRHAEPEEMRNIDDGLSRLTMHELHEIAEKEGAELAPTQLALINNILANRAAKGGMEADELDDINDMATLRDIADAEGADLKASKVEQRRAIRENRARLELEAEQAKNPAPATAPTGGDSPPEGTTAAPGTESAPVAEPTGESAPNPAPGEGESTPDGLDGMGMAELRAIAKAEGVGKMPASKAGLAEAIRENRKEKGAGAQ